MSADFDLLAAALAEGVGGVGPEEGALAYVLLDVFTETPLEGNQLAVFADGRGLDAGRMQALAREMNLSETVFVLPAEEGGDARIRIFTPLSELSFAGHPTLGSAFAISSALGSATVRLETGIGTVPVEVERAGSGPWFGRMRQAIPSWAPFEREAELLAALGVERSGLPVEAYENGPLHVYVELESPEAVAELHPDMAALAALGGSAPTASPARDCAGRPGCSPPPTASPRIPPPAPPRARSRSISVATGGSRSVRRSRSARAPSSAAPRPSWPARAAAPSRSSGSRSRAAR